MQDYVSRSSNTPNLQFQRIVQLFRERCGARLHWYAEALGAMTAGRHCQMARSLRHTLTPVAVCAQGQGGLAAARQVLPGQQGVPHHLVPLWLRGTGGAGQGGPFPLPPLGLLLLAANACTGQPTRPTLVACPPSCPQELDPYSKFASEWDGWKWSATLGGKPVPFSSCCTSAGFSPSCQCAPRTDC